jgi:molecular chaperone GrpE
MDEQGKKHVSRGQHTPKPQPTNKNEKGQLNGEDSPPSHSGFSKTPDEFQQELEKANQTAAQNLDGWQRERAEFSNYKRRVERDQSQQRQLLTGEVIKKYLVILDDLELALKNQPGDGDGATWAEGITLIVRKLQSIIDNEGIERINQNNVPFDPNLHEAISNEETSDFESGYIIEVVRQGYKLGDRILRPAMVRVAR